MCNVGVPAYKYNGIWHLVTWRQQSPYHHQPMLPALGSWRNRRRAASAAALVSAASNR